MFKAAEIYKQPDKDDALLLPGKSKRNARPQPITKAFKHAFDGLWYFFLHERNGKIQLVAAVLSICCGFWLHISTGEWVSILLCVGAVLSLEMLNSAVEKLCDVVQKEYHPAIKIIKDVAAAAVLWFSLVSAAIAAFVYLPKIILLCSAS